jgi:hypothetical protein
MTNRKRKAEKPAPFRTGDGSERLTFPTYEDRYEPTLMVMVPGTEPPEIRELRRRLLNQRDIAARELGRRYHITDARWDLHRLLSDVAMDHCFAREPEETLRCARIYGVKLLQAAEALAALEDCYARAHRPVTKRRDSTES